MNGGTVGTRGPALNLTGRSAITKGATPRPESDPLDARRAGDGKDQRARMPMTPTSRPPAIRLAFSRLFWRLMIGWFLLFALLVGLVVWQRFPLEKRAIAFLFVMPMYTATAFSIAAGMTVVADLVVRVFVRPRMLSWLAPKADADQSNFHLEPRERAIGDAPARMAVGRRWAPGRLVRTDRRLLFLPVAWDVEPWSVAQGRIEGVSLADSPRSFWGLIRGVPPRLEIQAEGEPARLFAVLDASALLPWFPTVANPEHRVS